MELRQDIQPTLDMQQRPPDWYTYVIQRTVADSVDKAIEKAMRDVRDDLKEIQDQIRTTNAATDARIGKLESQVYTREVLDTKLADLKRLIDEIRNFWPKAIAIAVGLLSIYSLASGHLSFR